MADFEVSAGIDPDEASLNAFASKIAAAMKDSLSDVGKQISKTLADSFAEITKKLASSDLKTKMKSFTDSAADGMKDVGFEAEKAAKKQQQLVDDANALAASLKAISKIKYVDPELFKLAGQNIQKLQRLTFELSKTDFSNPEARKSIEAEFAALRRTSIDSLKVITRVSDQAATEARQSFQRTTDAANASARERAIAARTAGEKEVQEARAAGKIMVVEAEKTRGLAIANRQAMYAALLRIESAGLRALEGVAKTGVGAIGKVFDATFGNIGRTVKQRFDVINTTTKTSLNRTEDITRQSLRKQESLYRESLSRTERVVSTYQKRVSTGLAGAVTGRGIGSGVAAIGGGFAIGKLISDGFNEAKNAIESANKAQVIFGNEFEGIRLLGENSAQALGLTKSAAVEAAASFGNLLRPLGATGGQAAFLSAGLTQLGADLASFNNTTLEEALTAIKAGLVGENEPLRRFGVQINDAALKAKALALGLYSGKGNLDAYAKSQAAIALIYEQTTLAQGDFARTSGEVANQVRITGANIKNLFGALLTYALPLVKVGLNGFNIALDNITKFIRGDVSGALNILRDGLIGAAAGLGALLAAKAGVEVIQLLGLVLKAALSPMGLAIVAFTGIGAAISILLKNTTVFQDILANFGLTFDTLKSKLLGFKDGALTAVGDFVQNKVVPAFESFATFVGEKVIPVAIEVGKRIGEIASTGAKIAVRFFNQNLVPALKLAWQALREFVTAGVLYAQAAWEKFGPRITSIAESVVDAIGRVKDVAADLLSGNKALLAGLGGAAVLGVAVLGPVGALLAGGAALLIGTFGDEIASGLKSVGETIVEFFNGIDWGALALTALAFVEKVGFIIGNIASDPRVLAGIAALGATAVVIGATFIEGVARGIADNLPELAGIALAIAKALADALTSNLAIVEGAIVAFFVGKALYAKIAAAVKSGATFLKTSVPAAFSSVFQNILSPKDLIANIQLSAGEAARAIRGGGGPLSALSASFKAAGQNLGLTTGQQIAVGIGAALGSGVSGVALGKGDVLGGLGGIIASSLAASAAGGPIVGAAVGGLGLVTAAFTRHAEQVKKAAAEVAEYKDVILAATDPTTVFFKNFQDESSGVKKALADAGFTVGQLTLAAQGNAAGVEAVISRLSALKNQARTKGDTFDIDAAERYGDAISFIKGELGEYTSGTSAAAVEAKVLGQASKDGASATQAWGERYAGIAQSIKDADTAARNASVAQSVSDAKTAADEAFTSLQLANTELLKFLNPEAGTVTETINSVIQGLPGLASQIQGGIDLGGALGKADVDQALAGFDKSIADIVTKGVEDGLSADQIKTALANLSVPISELDVPQEVKDSLLAQLTDAVFNAPIEANVDLKVKADQAAFTAAATEAAGRYGATLASKSGSLVGPGKALSEGAAKGISDGQKKVNDAIIAVANAAKAAFKKALDINSPSRVFVGFGENIGQGVILGIDSFVPKVGNASTVLGKSIGEQAAEGIRLSRAEAEDELTSFIDSLNDKIGNAQLSSIKTSLLGGQTLDEARTGIGAALKDVFDKGISIAGSIFGGKGGSFSFAGAEGISNRQTIFSAVGDIKQLAETLFEAGTPIGGIIDELNFMREALINTATSAGFSRDELVSLIDSLGLSTGAIASLAQATADAQKKVTDAAAAEKAKADAAAQRTADQQAADEAQKAIDEAKSKEPQIVNNFVVPYGDLEAIALTVSNTQASAAARRVRR